MNFDNIDLQQINALCHKFTGYCGSLIMSYKTITHILKAGFPYIIYLPVSAFTLFILYIIVFLTSNSFTVDCLNF